MDKPFFLEGSHGDAHSDLSLFFFEFKDWYETLRSIDVKCEVQIKFSKTVALQHHFVSF